VAFSRAKQSKNKFFFDGFTSAKGTHRLSRNVGNYQSMLRNIPEERPSHINSNGRSKSRKLTLRLWHGSTFQLYVCGICLPFVSWEQGLLNNINYYLRFSIPFATHSGRNWEHANPKGLRNAKFISCTALHCAKSI